MMFLGMFLWNLWKERKNRIFRDKKNSKEEFWKRLVNNLQETIRSKQWGDRDKDLIEAEARIAAKWGIDRKCHKGL